MAQKLKEPDAPAHVIEIAKKYFQCTCGDIYLSRNLTAPDCPYHAYNWEEFTEEILKHSTPTVSAEEVLDNICYADEAKMPLHYSRKTMKHNGLEYEMVHRDLVIDAMNQFRTHAPEGVVKEGETYGNHVFKSCKAAAVLAKEIWGSEHLSCQGNLEIKLQDILINTYKKPAPTTPAPADSVAAPVEVEELAKQCVIDLGWQDDGTAEPEDIKRAFKSGYSHTPAKGGREKCPDYFIHEGNFYDCIGNDEGMFWVDNNGTGKGFDQSECTPLYIK